MDDAQPVKLTLSGSIAYEKGVTVLQAAELIRFLEAQSEPSSGGLGAGIPNHESGMAGPHHNASKTTPRQALTDSGASTNPEKIVALALNMLTDVSGDTFKVTQVKSEFERAKEGLPQNFGRDLDVAIRKGWIVESSSTPGSYYISHDGETAVSNKFGHKAKPSSTNGDTTRARKRTPRSRTTASTVPTVFADLDEIPQQLDGVPRYSEMKTPKDRLLWALYMAKHLGLDGLDNKAIVWATDHLGSGISGKHVGVYFEYNRKDNFANTSLATKLKRITPDGERHLQAMLANG